MGTLISAGLQLNNLSTLTFEFCRADGTSSTAPIRLLPDGVLDGYYHRNETCWRLVDGNIALIAHDGRPSTVFDRITEAAGKLVLEGDFLLRPDLKIVHQLREIEWDFKTRKRPEKLTAKMLADDIARYGWTVGDHTYGAPNVIEKQYAKLHIGKFCSIAGGVLIALGNHRMDGVTTYPFATMAKYWPSMRGFADSDHATKGDVRIGNDVWIGQGATILSGVTIGDGAVIAAHSVVTKNVPAFAIYGGNPGKVIKYRHSPHDIEALAKIKWWDWDDETLNDRLPLLMGDMQAFIERYRVR